MRHISILPSNQNLVYELTKWIQVVFRKGRLQTCGKKMLKISVYKNIFNISFIQVYKIFKTTQIKIQKFQFFTLTINSEQTHKPLKTIIIIVSHKRRKKIVSLTKKERDLKKTLSIIFQKYKKKELKIVIFYLIKTCTMKS